MRLSREYKDTFVRDFELYYKQYRCQFVKKVRGRANIFVPLTRGLIDSQLPRFVGRRPIVEYNAKEQQYRQYNPMINAHFREMWRKGNMPMRMIEMSKMSLMFGFVGGYVPWVQKPRRVRVRERVRIPGLNMALPFYHFVEREKMIFEGPICFPVAPWRLFWDPEGIDVDSCGWMGHLDRIDRERVGKALHSKRWQLKDGQQKSDLNTLLEKADPWKRFYLYHYHEDDKMSLMLYAGDPGDTTSNYKTHGSLNVSEYQALSPDAGPWFTVYQEDMPFDDGEKPYVVGRNVPLVQEFEGTGECEAVRPQNKELNIIRSTKLDRVNASINRMWKIRKEAKIDVAQLQFRPNGIIEVAGMPLDEAIKELHTSDTYGTSLEDEEAIKKDAFYATGQSDTRMGAGNDRNERTATALLQADAGGDARIAMKVELFELGVYEPLGHKYLSRSRQFITEDREFAEQMGATTKDWVVGPEELAQEYDVTVRGKKTHPQNKQLRIKDITTWMNIIRIMPPLAERTNPDVLINELAERFELDDIPGLVYGPEELEQRRQQAQALMQKQQQGQTINGADVMRVINGGRP